MALECSVDNMRDFISVSSAFSRTCTRTTCVLRGVGTAARGGSVAS